MTDSLSVQPQIQKKDNTVPYGIGGAAIGGIGGAVAANYGYGIKTKPDLDKVFAMEPDTFKKHIENAGENKGAWETAQEYANKIKDAEKDYDAKIAEIKEKAKSAVDNLPADNDAKKALDTAQTNYDKKLTELVDAEKAKLEAGNAKVTSIDPKKIKTYAELSKENINDKLPKTYVAGKNKGKAIPTSEYETLYNTLTNNYKNEYNNMQKALDKGLRDKKATYIDCFNDLAKQAYNDTKSISKREKIAGRLVSDPRYNDVLYQAKAMSEIRYEDVKSLTNDEIISIASDVKGKGMKELTVDVVDSKTGLSSKKSYYYKQDDYNKLLKTKQQEVKNLRKEHTNKLMEEVVNTINLRRDIDELPKKFNSQIIKEGKGTESFIYKGKTYTGYGADIKNLEDAMRNGKPLPKNLNGNYGKVTPKEALALANARNAQFADFTRQEKALQQKLDVAFKDNPIVKEFDDAIANEIKNNKKVVSAKKALVDQFPGLFEQGAKLSADEIATQAKTKADEAIAKLDVATKLQKAKDDAKAAAEKLGITAKELTDEEAIKQFGKTKEEFVKNVKDDATKAVEKNLEKMKIANKTWTGIAAAAALGLAGMGIAMLNKKDA